MIKIIEQQELERAIELVNRVFTEFVAPDYSEEGRATFENYLESKYDEVAFEIESGHKKMWGYYENGEILGVISTRDISHISLLFVDKNYHRRGIAKEMFGTVLEDIKGSPEITVNSSPYAVEVYRHLGFNATGPEAEKNGILFVPMTRPVCIQQG